MVKPIATVRARMWEIAALEKPPATAIVSAMVKRLPRAHAAVKLATIAVSEPTHAAQREAAATMVAIVSATVTVPRLNSQSLPLHSD